MQHHARAPASALDACEVLGTNLEIHGSRCAADRLGYGIASRRAVQLRVRGRVSVSDRFAGEAFELILDQPEQVMAGGLASDAAVAPRFEDHFGGGRVLPERALQVVLYAGLELAGAALNRDPVSSESAPRGHFEVTLLQ